MTPHEPRRPDYYAASHWFQGAVFLVVIGLLVIGILSALDDAKERAERLAVDLTIRNMRTGMQLAMGEALMQQREGEIASWAGSNPVRWLGAPPTGYRGECSAAERRGLAGGEWCFERERRELVYRPRNAEYLRPEQCGHLSWRLVRAPESATRGSFVGLRLEPAAVCQWFLEGR